MIPPATNVASPLRTLWWLQPAWLFGIASLGTVGWAVAMDRNGYRLYDVPKYIDELYLLFAAMAVAAFTLGTWLSRGWHVSEQQSTPKQELILLRCFWISAGLCIFGYVVWLLVGIKNGFRPGMLLDFIAMNDSKLETFEFKDRIFPTVPGVTTLTQCGMMCVILGLLPALRKQRYVLPTVCGVVAIAFLRAMMLSERLALIELVVTGGIVFLRVNVLGKLRHEYAKIGLRVAPVLGPLLLLVLFGAFEYFRSYRHYQDKFNNIAEFTVWRVSAYYTLGHNNAALIMKKRDGWPLPYYSVAAVWAFPLVKYSPLTYEKITGVNVPQEFERLLRMYASREYNNEGGLFSPLTDFGLPGFTIFWGLFGVLCGIVQRSYIRGNLLGICFYPIIFLTLLETPRFLYISLSRCTPQLVILLVLWYLFTFRRAASPAIAGPSEAMAPATS